MRIPTELIGEYTIRLMDMPPRVKSFVTFDEYDFANIYINSRLNVYQQREATKHEIRHLLNDDIHSTEDIRTIEARAGA